MSRPAETWEQRYSGTEFLEGLAHELRGPAGVTLGALDEIELALGAEAERVRPLLLIARRGAKRLLRTADRLQLTGRLEAKQTDGERSHVELGVLVECAARDAEELESRRGIRVSTKYPEGECMVNVDPTWLRTVIMELVGHSIRRARTSVSIAAAVEDSSVKIAIRDDGVDRPKPIIRGNPGSLRPGPGLSLALARDIAAAQGGNLFVEHRQGSDPRDRGASFLLVMPTATAD